MKRLLLSVAVLLGLYGSVAWASSVNRARSCLRRADLACAERVLEDATRGSEEALQIEAFVAFYQGRYDDSLAALDALKARGLDLEAEAPNTPFRPTAEAATDFVRHEGKGSVVRHARGVDAVLAEEALESLEASRRTYDRLFGGGPGHDVVLDIFPTASRFILASGLPPEAVRTTGVVALSKWTRLLVTSPRALARGYGWKDTVAHEYIHLVVSYRTGDQAPVWLQEGLAKQLEGYWRGEVEGVMPANQQSLLAEAVAHDTFVPFEKFKHSMAYLDTSEEAALAFAQVSTMIRFLIVSSGEASLPRVLDRVRQGEDSQQVVAEEAGFDSWAEFRAGWLAWLRTLPLVEAQLASLPVVLDGEGDEYSTDPLLAGKPELQRFTRLGDLLRDAGRPKAALIEYEKATDPDGPPSPLLLARRAACHQALGDLDSALAVVEEGVTLYPEFTLLQKTRGEILAALGRTEEAVVAFRLAHDLNPYDPAVQRALVKGYESLGQAERAARHLRYARILATGGALVDG